MRLIDADRLLTDRMKSKYYHLSNGDIAIPLIDIEHAPTIEPEQKWIPCSDRLPDNTDLVIVWVKDDMGDTSFDYSSSGWITTNKEYWIVDGEINNYVIAWMPLPKPYEGENDG